MKLRKNRQQSRPSDIIIAFSNVEKIECVPQLQHEDDILEMQQRLTCIISGPNFERQLRTYEEHLDIKGSPPYNCSISIVNYKHFEKLKESDKRGMRELIAGRGNLSDEKEMNKLRTGEGKFLGEGGIFQHHIFCRPTK